MNMLNTIERMENNPYLSRGFKQVIEDHFLLIKESSMRYNIAPVYQNRFNGNFYGLLAEVKVIPFELFWITLRANDLCSPYDYREGHSELLIPDDTYISNLFQLYNTHRIK